LKDRRTRVVEASDAVLDALSPARTPSGIVALAPRPAVAREALVTPAPALVMVAVDIQDPGNVGAMVRAADPAGATRAIATMESADPLGWKALRGSMGSALRLPVWPRAAWPEVQAFLNQHTLRVVAAAPGARESLYDIDWSLPTAVLLGTEG